ncbi:GGDEF domain-containing protein [Dechloromonas sp. ZY10]|uniref:diguanylate cyclase domain-containing protein n=1 Tax=Dechloromonas aquae TaxID=2664436 RepID=UPI0035294749
MIGRLLAAETAFDPLLHPYRVRADRIMVGMNVFLLFVCLVLAPLRATFLSVLLVGLPTLSLAFWLNRAHAGALATRLFMASGFMIFTGLIIHQTGGDIEAHFSAFGLIGVLLYYRDWRTIVVATVVIYLHHLVLGYAQSLGAPIYVFDNDRFWATFGIHIAYFLPFIGMMVYLAIWLRREGYESQHVIALAQRILQGNLVEDEQPVSDEANMPLITAVRMMKARLLDLLRVMPVAAAVIRIDTETIVSVNEAWVRTIGTLDDSQTRFGASPIWADPATWDSLMARMREASYKLLDKIEVMLRKADGTPFLCELSLILHEEIDPVMAILTIEDITLRRKTEQTMQRLAYRDMLTDLPNRVSLHAAIELALEQWRERSIPCAVVMMDLDGFKPVNDTYGHDAGDEVLRVIGARLQHVNRASDVAARLGGDEFAIVLNDCPGAAAAAEVARRLIEAVARPIRLAVTNVTVKVGASAGVAHVSAGEADPEVLLKNADCALYAAKAGGKNRVAMFPLES